MRTATVIRLVVLVALAARPGFAQQVFCDPFTFCNETGSTDVEFELTAGDTVTVRVVDLWFEQTVRELSRGWHAAGFHRLTWDGRDEQGQLVETGSYRVLVEGTAGRGETTCSAVCREDLTGPHRETVGGKDVRTAFSMALGSTQEAELALFAADGTTRLSVLYSGTFYGGGTQSLLTVLSDSSGSRLPFGTYIARLDAETYDEDIVFTYDPIVPGVLAVQIQDTAGVFHPLPTDPAEAPTFSGPLQGAWIGFGRSMSTVELDHILHGGGLRLMGSLRHLAWDSLVVAPDSSAVMAVGFTPSRPWPDVFGRGSFYGWGMFEPAGAHVLLRHDLVGIACRDRACTPICPGGFFDAADFSCPVDGQPGLQACPNPVAPGEDLDLHLQVAEAMFVTLVIADDQGEVVQVLSRDVGYPGPVFLTWDLNDRNGLPVPEGMYRLIWERDGAVVCSGDIRVGPDLSAASDGSAVPGAGVPTLANRPNPFNPATAIHYTVPRAGRVRLAVHDLDGRRVATLLDGSQAPGAHVVHWNGRDGRGAAVASGVYIARLEAAGAVATTRMTLLK